MLKKFSLIFCLAIILSSFFCFAAETFEYDNILYTIVLVEGENDDASTLEVTAEGYVDLSNITVPPQTLLASEIYDLLGYEDSDVDATDISSALSALGDSSLAVKKSSLIEDLTGESSGGYYDESGLFIPNSFDEAIGATSSAPVEEKDENQIKVVLRENLTGNETKVSFPDQKPILVNDRTLIPARGVFEQLGYQVDWDDETSTAIVSGIDITVKISINSKTIYKNDEAISLDVPAQLIGDRTMIPLRAVSEALDLVVDWEESTNTVIINVPF